MSSGRARGPGGRGSPGRWGAIALPELEARLAAAVRGRVGTRCEKPPGRPRGPPAAAPWGGVGERPPAQWFQLGSEQVTWMGSRCIWEGHGRSPFVLCQLCDAPAGAAGMQVPPRDGVNVRLGAEGGGCQARRLLCPAAHPRDDGGDACVLGGAGCPLGPPLSGVRELVCCTFGCCEFWVILGALEGFVMASGPGCGRGRRVFSGSVAQGGAGDAHFLMSPAQPGPAGMLQATRPQAPG